MNHAAHTTSERLLVAAVDTSRGGSRGLLMAALAAFLLTRWYLIFSFQPAGSDADFYFQAVVQTVDFGRQPYGEVMIEYPPLAYAAAAAPRWLAAERIRWINDERFAELLPTYLQHFTYEMAVCDALALLLLLMIVRRRRPELLAVAAWCYVLVTTMLAHVLFQRLDVGLLACLMLWAWAATRAAAAETKRGVWTMLTAAALGLGTAYKIFPIVILPAMLAGLWRDKSPGRVQRALLATAAFLATAVAPFVVAWSTAGDAIFNPFRMHAERGVQIESVYASALMLLRPLGLPVEAAKAARWEEMRGDAASWCVNSSTMIVLVMILAPAIWLTITRRTMDRTAGYRWGLWTLAAATLASKVLSPQFMVWLLPMLLLLGVELLPRRQFVALGALLLLAATLTTAVFPYLYLPVVKGLSQPSIAALTQLDWLPVTLLAARNGLLLMIVGWLGVRNVRYVALENT